MRIGSWMLLCGAGALLGVAASCTPPAFRPTLAISGCPQGTVVPGEAIILTAVVLDPAGNDISLGSGYDVAVRATPFEVDAVTVDNTVTITLPETASAGTAVLEVTALFAGARSPVKTCTIEVGRE